HFWQLRAKNRQQICQPPEVVYDVEATGIDDEPAREPRHVSDVAPPGPFTFAPERFDAAVDLGPGRRPERQLVPPTGEHLGDIRDHALDPAVVLRRNRDVWVHDDEAVHPTISFTSPQSAPRSFSCSQCQRPTAAAHAARFASRSASGSAAHRAKSAASAPISPGGTGPRPGPRSTPRTRCPGVSVRATAMPARMYVRALLLSAS